MSRTPRTFSWRIVPVMLFAFGALTSLGAAAPRFDPRHKPYLSFPEIPLQLAGTPVVVTATIANSPNSTVIVGRPCSLQIEDDHHRQRSAARAVSRADGGLSFRLRFRAQDRRARVTFAGTPSLAPNQGEWSDIRFGTPPSPPPHPAPTPGPGTGTGTGGTANATCMGPYGRLVVTVIRDGIPQQGANVLLPPVLGSRGALTSAAGVAVFENVCAFKDVTISAGESTNGQRYADARHIDTFANQTVQLTLYLVKS